MTDLLHNPNRLLTFDRVLYFFGLPAIMLNYGISSVLSLILGDPSGASQLTLLIYLLLVFPVAIIALLCVVWAQITARTRQFSTLIRAALIAVIADVLLIGLLFVPSNEGTALKAVANPGSVFSRFLGLSVEVSQGAAQFLIYALPGIMIFLAVVSVVRAKENQQEFDDSLNLR